MYIAPVNRPSRRLRRDGAFTLLEIMFAVAILAMMSVSIYRFVTANVTALRISSETSAIDAQYSGFANLLAAEWQTLPSGKGALTGEPLKLDDRARDEITWTTSAGPGLLTRYAIGEYQVSMRLRPAEKGSERMEIGFARKTRDETEIGGGDAAESWVPLLSGVQSLQIRYFDPRLNTWVDRWTDTITLPRLVKVTIGRGDAPAWETIVALGRTPL